MSRYDFVVFDVNGTLLIPDPEPAVVYLQIAAQHPTMDSRPPVSLEEMRARLKTAISTHFSAEACQQPTDEEGERIRWRRIVDDCLLEWDQSARTLIFTQLWSHFADAQQWKIYDDVRETISKLRDAGYRIAAASNFDNRLRIVIEGLAISSWLDRLLISSELGWSKPNVRFYLQAAGELKLADPARAIMIGDTKVGDVDAAQKAGWDAAHLIRDQDRALPKLVDRYLFS